MTWVTLDDASPTHRKQLSAGALACWLWTCGLAYCYRQNSDDGFIPEAAIKLLYPGLGKKEADRLVKVGLWVRVEGGYFVHEYLEWRQRRFEKKVRGQAGGSVSSPAKQQAAFEREARKRGSTTNHNEPQADGSTTKPTTTTSPMERNGDGDGLESSEGVQGGTGDPERETVCPLDLLQRRGVQSMLREMAEKLSVPIALVESEASEFVGYWTHGKGIGRTRSNWPRVLRERLRKRHLAGELGRFGSGRNASEDRVDWPTDDALRLREAIRAGKHGERLQAKERAGQLDHALAMRLVRERDQALREREGQRLDQRMDDAREGRHESQRATRDRSSPVAAGDLITGIIERPKPTGSGG